MESQSRSQALEADLAAQRQANTELTQQAKQLQVQVDALKKSYSSAGEQGGPLALLVFLILGFGAVRRSSTAPSLPFWVQLPLSPPHTQCTSNVTM